MLGTAGSTKNPCKILKLWSKVRNVFNLVNYIKCQYSVAMQEAACSLKKGMDWCVMHPIQTQLLLPIFPITRWFNCLILTMSYLEALQ